MAIAFDKHVGNATGSMATTVVITVAAGGVASGNLVIVRCAVGNVTIDSCADSRGNTYTGISANTVEGGDLNSRNFVSLLGTALQAGDTITVTLSGKSAGIAAADAWSGVSSATPVAQNEGQGTSTAPASGSATPTAIGQLVFGGTGFEVSGEPTNDSDTTDGSWSQLTYAAGTNANVDGAYKIVTGTSAQTYNETISSSNWVCEIAVFGAASTGTEANAGAASGTGAANNAGIQIYGTSGAATGTGAAGTPTASLGVPAGAASGTGAAGQPTASVTGVAENAEGTGTAYAATPNYSSNIPAAAASAAGTAEAAQVSLAPGTGTADSTGAAGGPTSTVAPVVGTASGDGTANQPSILTGTVVVAGAAEATGTANGLTALLSPGSGTAGSTGAAGGPNSSVAPTSDAAAGTGSALAATVSTSGNTNADAGHASATGTANGITVSLAPGTGSAGSTGAAGGPSSSVTPTSGVATSTGTANAATVTSEDGGAPVETALARHRGGRPVPRRPKPQIAQQFASYSHWQLTVTVRSGGKLETTGQRATVTVSARPQAPQMRVEARSKTTAEIAARGEGTKRQTPESLAWIADRNREEEAFLLGLLS